jgi:hypothetical protein
MSRWLSSFALLVLSIAATAVAARPDAPLTERALSASASEANAAVAALRAQGQAGVDALAAAGTKLTGPVEIARYRAALDRVCRQRDCYASRLYWYTDLAAAKAAARAQHKPILSLRLLGQLDEDLSCANSRFFRTTLYPDRRISYTLRQNFILHWSSERPVPRVTIDFGDGRKICSTITGNSAHYLLSADGTPLDVIPGLYSPDAFLAQLDALHVLAANYEKSANPRAWLRQYHTGRFTEVRGLRDSEVYLAREPLPQAQNLDDTKLDTVKVIAAMASSLAMTKGVLEVPLLRDLGQPVDDSTWKKISSAHVAGVQFDPISLALMKEKAPNFSEETLARLRQTVAQDALRNEYDLHLRIHQWFAMGRATNTFKTLNQRVYAELFLTPRTDPWLGLRDDDAFSAIAGGGVIGSR